VSRQGIHAFCRARGLVIRDEAGYTDYLPRGRIFGPLARGLVRTISALSLGRLDGRYNNLTLVIEK
jgi:hypothetical protein